MYKYVTNTPESYQTDTDTDLKIWLQTDTDIWFGIQIKQIIGINQYHTDICMPI